MPIRPITGRLPRTPTIRTSAWSVNFYDGCVDDYFKDYGFYVRCVRGGQGGSLGSFDHFEIKDGNGGAIYDKAVGEQFPIKITALNADGTVKTDCEGEAFLSATNGLMAPWKLILTPGGITIAQVSIGAPGAQISIKVTACGLSGASNIFNVGAGCTGSLGGTVKQFRTPLNGANVYLEGTDGSHYDTLAMGKNGEYNFTSIPSGNYTLWASYNGGESDRIEEFIGCNPKSEELNVYTACNANGKTPVLWFPESWALH